tara:strand:+ start:62764 stop:64473 length:1710 start_codon:yes stop_codon:yes gene_type:complete
MGSNNIIVREYLESLKEDNELDYLFPILLNSIGFRIISTPVESKGQSQYGKDIVAVGKDESGITHRYYFELKGHSDRNITDKNYSIPDGIRESIIEAKDTAFRDSSIPKFNHLPIKVVLVHNGTIKSNIRPTFEGFVSKEFKPGEFERWDIYRLTDLFAEHFFNAYLLTDRESLNLFKKTLVLLDAPQNDFGDFHTLVDLQIEKIGTVKGGRAFSKFFATQNLLASIILHYSLENNNLEPARQCLTYLLLKTWSWILKNQLESKRAVKREYTKLVSLHNKMLALYFDKTLLVARKENGLYSEIGAAFEEVGFPLRCFDYLNYMIYYFESSTYNMVSLSQVSEHELIKFRREQKDILIEIIESNDGCKRPILDSHSIAIVNLILFFIKKNDLTENDAHFLHQYLFRTTENILITHRMRGRFPYVGTETGLVKSLRGREKAIKENTVPPSLIVPILFELACLFNLNQMHSAFAVGFKDKLNLQTAYPNLSLEIEEKLFEKHFHDEFYVETNIELKDSLNDFKKHMMSKANDSIEFRTDAAGFGFLRLLAHVYYKNEFFPQEWRKYYNSNGE